LKRTIRRKGKDSFKGKRFSRYERRPEIVSVKIALDPRRDS